MHTRDYRGAGIYEGKIVAVGVCSVLLITLYLIYVFQDARQIGAVDWH